MEYNKKQVEKSHYTLVIALTIISYILFLPLWFKKYIILHSLIYSILFVSIYLNIKLKKFILCICLLVEILDTTILGICQIKYLIINYMKQYFYKYLKLQDSIILVSNVICTTILCIFMDYLIKIGLGFYCDVSEYILHIIYTSLFSLMLISLAKKL
jgi:hypothetical protein